MKIYYTEFGTVAVDESKEWWKGYAYIKREDLLPDYPDYFMPYKSPDGEIADLLDLDPDVYYNEVKGQRDRAPDWLVQSAWGEYTIHVWGWKEITNEPA